MAEVAAEDRSADQFQNMTARSTTSGRPYVVIEPPTGWPTLDLADLWRYRDMIWLSVLRDITARYKQSLFGPLWIIVLPLVGAGLFSVVLGALGGLPADGDEPYVVMVYAGMLIWGLFSRAFQSSSESIAVNQHIITKVYYPRLVSPIAGSLGGLLDYTLGMVLLGVILAVSGTTPSGWSVLAVPGCGLLAIFTGMSLGLWIASASARVRDLRYASTILLQLGMWTAPVVYSSRVIFEAQRVPEAYQGLVVTIFQLNPLYPVIEGFKSAMLGVPYRGSPVLAAVSIGIMLVLLISGMLYFRRVERTVADII
jgi:lipopolysaccharide transport system permease protein